MRIAAKKSFLLQALSAAQFASSFSPSLASARRIPSSALFSTKTDTMTTDVANFIDSTNAGYEKLHLAYELQFWGTKMALSGPEYSTDELTRTKGEMEAFLADESKLAKTRDLLGSVPADSAEAKTLKMLERTFGCYIMESEEAQALRSEATKIEGKLEGARNTLSLGATIDGKFEEMSSVGLRNKVRVDPDESVRKACYEGLSKIGDFVTENGFVELVKVRNRMAKALGYLDFYDYKVTNAEGFGKVALFEILDTLEEGTRPIMEAARKRFADEKGGENSLEPWNLSFLMAGDVTRRMDPYFPFEKSVEQWGRSFAAMNIGYRGATMDLDLLDRKGKYSNGFCHWPQPAWVKPDGSFQPSTTHFTSLADPSAIGSGHTGLTTLMHEAGHAAHFANVDMPSPLFSQERSPTSVAYAELQSMFLDSLVGDADWMAKYAISRDGDAIPWDLVADQIEATHPYKVFALRGMIAVPYFEKALYEMAEEDVTAESIKALADKVEKDIQGGLSPRPLLSVPHILSDEASCYYHGYVLAEMGVHQTRQFFLERDGFISDNPKVGPTVTDAYWKPGNSEPFLSLVESLTGSALTGKAWVNELKQSVEDVLKEEKVKYDTKRAECVDASDGDIDLDMRIRIVDGDEVLADTAKEGSFLATCKVFETYVQNRYAKTN
jgi:oligoendopeptidase F